MVEKITKKYGFIPDKILPEDYVFGVQTKLSAEKRDILQLNGQWDEFLPDNEEQERNGLETMNCTTYGTENALEVLFRRLFKEKKDWSERFIGVLAGTTLAGNSPQNVIQTVRHSGLIDEKLLPFDDTIKTWDQYYSPNPMDDWYTAQGLKFLKSYEIGHEWVFTSPSLANIPKLMQELNFSPLGVSVYAWEQNENGLYIKPKGTEDNHWCILYGYEYKKFWKIFDSYDNTQKRLAWGFQFGFAKRYSIKKKEEKIGFLSKIWQAIKDYFKMVWET
jgi:hypothetical protein